MSKKPDKKGTATIAVNKKAWHDFFIEERVEAGLALTGWEVKSLRAGRVQMRDTYVLLKQGEAYMIGTLITPLGSASTHVITEPGRTRKLLLHREELNRLIGYVERKGYTLIPVSLYWKNGRAKVELALARGKQSHDKRATEKDRDWQREKQRIFQKSRR